MTTKVDRVTAKFGGRENLNFQIERELLPHFEIMIEEPAQHRLRRLVTGAATVNDIREVLEFAAPKGLGRDVPRPDKSSGGAHDILKMRLTLERMRPVSETFVAKVLKESPPLKYAVLAQGVLAAALLGIPEEASHFDEDEEANEDAA